MDYSEPIRKYTLKEPSVRTFHQIEAQVELTTEQITEVLALKNFETGQSPKVIDGIPYTLVTYFVPVGWDNLDEPQVGS